MIPHSVYFTCLSNKLDFDPPSCHFMSQIEAEVEVYRQPDFTKEIVGGVLGGLALLALLTAGLYKVRLSKYIHYFSLLYSLMESVNGVPPPIKVNEHYPFIF